MRSSISRTDTGSYWLRNRALILSAIAITVFGNFTFYGLLFETYRPSSQPIFVAGLSLSLCAMTLLVVQLVAWGRAARWVLPVFFLVTALSAYFMDSFKVVLSPAMLQNALQTDVQEATDLITWKLAKYLLLLFVLPTFLIRKDARLKARIPWITLLRDKGFGIVVCALAVLVPPLLSEGSFQSFFREQHTALYFNPVAPLTSAVKLATDSKVVDPSHVAPYGNDARIPADDKHRELLVIVIGETVRADHFSLNGYPRRTNPELSRENVFNFGHFYSCGTSTNISVPCMFSGQGRSDFDEARFRGRENLLDVVSHAGASVLWRDNNSSSKGVAVRPGHVEYQDFRNSRLNPVCDTECRDEGMLSGLQEWIDAHPGGDLVIVLHQMGSHGPAYYKRYPETFERFTPACNNIQLEQCTRQEIVNAYDNTILYTDYFLSQTIALLKKNTSKFEAAMFYVGDHGESLGEYGLYLHAMPYALAPDEQTHVPAVLWLSDNVDEIDRAALQEQAQQPYSHDNLFHTVLGFLEIHSEVYEAALDILANDGKGRRRVVGS